MGYEGIRGTCVGGLCLLPCWLGCNSALGQWVAALLLWVSSKVWRSPISDIRVFLKDKNIFQMLLYMALGWLEASSSLNSLYPDTHCHCDCVSFACQVAAGVFPSCLQSPRFTSSFFPLVPSFPCKACTCDSPASQPFSPVSESALVSRGFFFWWGKIM